MSGLGNSINQGTLTTGNTVTGGSSDATVFNQLVQGDLAVQGDCSIGQIVLESARVEGNFTIDNGNLVVDSGGIFCDQNAIIGDGLQVIGNSYFQGDVSIQGTLEVKEGSGTYYNGVVTKNAGTGGPGSGIVFEADGDAEITGNAYISGDIFLNGNVTASFGTPTTLAVASTQNQLIASPGSGFVVCSTTIPAGFSNSAGDITFFNVSFDVVWNPTAGGLMGKSTMNTMKYGIVELPWNGNVDSRFKTASTINYSWIPQLINGVWTGVPSGGSSKINTTLRASGNFTSGQSFGVVCVGSGGSSNSVVNNTANISSLVWSDQYPGVQLGDVQQPITNNTPVTLRIQTTVFPYDIGQPPFPVSGTIKIAGTFPKVIGASSFLFTYTSRFQDSTFSYYVGTYDGFNLGKWNGYINVFAYTQNSAQLLSSVDGAVTGVLTATKNVAASKTVDVSTAMTLNPNGTTLTCDPIFAVNDVQNVTGTHSFQIQSVAELNSGFTLDRRDAIFNANNPSALNPFATISDVSVPAGTVEGAVQFRSSTGTLDANDDFAYLPAQKRIKLNVRADQELNPGSSYAAVNGYYGLAKDAYPLPDPTSAGVKAVQTWHATTSIGSNGWFGVCWSPQLRIFVAVANSGSLNRAATSPDGITWTLRTTNDNTWQKVCWSPELGLFAAVSNSGSLDRVMTSPDGITWTTQTTPNDNSFSDICWSPELGLFAAVSNGGITNRVITSPDGITWTERATAGYQLFAICWAPELSLFVGTGAFEHMVHSTDGITWTSFSSGIPNDIRGITWSPELGIFVAIGRTGTDRARTSPNGITWTARTIVARDYTRVRWSPELGVFVATCNCNSTQAVTYSPDGINWTSTVTNPNQQVLRDVCWAPELGLFAAVASGGAFRAWFSSHTGRPPTSYNVFDSDSNRINNNTRDWTLQVSNLTSSRTQIDSGARVNQLLNTGSTWGAVNGYYALAKDVYPSLNPYSSGNLAVTTWNSQTCPSINWRSVCWSPELGIFVAVSASGSSGRIMTSPNGVNWTSIISAADTNAWLNVVWASELGIFVAVAISGTGDRVITSPDGINWTLQTSAADNQWYSVVWAAELGILVAVSEDGAGNRVMTSPDGINWTSRVSAANNQWRSVCWAPELELFVAVALSGSGNRIMTSPDGINWVTRASPLNLFYNSVCWSPELGIFVAVAFSGTGQRVMTSTNGINWTARNSAADIEWRSVVWAPELQLFVAVASSGVSNRVMTSPDGINWTLKTSAADNEWFGVCWAPELGIFAAVAVSGIDNRVMTSSYKGRPPTSLNVFDDNSNRLNETTRDWNFQVGGFTSSRRNITCGTRLNQVIQDSPAYRDVNGHLGLAKDAYPIVNPYSTSAKVVTTWNTRVSATNNWRSVCWAPELRLFVAVGASGTNDRAMTSPDGVTWTSRTTNDNNWVSVCWSPELSIFVAVGSNGTNDHAMTSPDGITWTTQTTNSNQWFSVCWAAELGLFAAVSLNGSSDRVMTSPDGVTWTTRTTSNNSYRSITWSPELGIFVAVSTDGTVGLQGQRVMISSDGITWQNIITPFLECTSVSWSSQLGLLAAVGNFGASRVMTSSDGLNWTLQISDGTHFWWNITWAAELGLFVAVANNTSGTARILYSNDGVDWTLRDIGTPNFGVRSICWAPELGILVAVSTDSSTSDKVITSSFPGRLPTSYNVFDSDYNRIDSNGQWSLQAKNISSIADIELQPSATGNLIFTGTALQSSSAGANSGEHLVITLNGTQYKIKLETP